jgi:hypothetical protein
MGRVGGGGRVACGSKLKFTRVLIRNKTQGKVAETAEYKEMVCYNMVWYGTVWFGRI